MAPFTATFCNRLEREHGGVLAVPVDVALVLGGDRLAVHVLHRLRRISQRPRQCW